MISAANLTLLAVVWAVVLVERFVELVINRRHVAKLRKRGGVFHEPDGFSFILVVQVLLFTLIPIELIFSPWAGVWQLTWPMLGVVLLAQVLRYWVIRTLGDRWSMRVVTLPGKHRILAGPYRWMRHPNYLAVALETVALPLAFGAFGAFVVLAVLQVLALKNRIRIEDEAMAAAVHAS